MARNSLTQRPPGPESIATVELVASGMVAGDAAGLALLNAPCAWIGLVKSPEGVTLRTYDQTNRKTTEAPTKSTHVWLHVACNFDTEKAAFSWSANGKDFAPLGDTFIIAYQLMTFQGVRFSLFNFNTSGQPGGYADFDNFKVDEPRTWGSERAIPVGKSITLSSGADGSFLAADIQNMSLVNVAADSPSAAARNIRFKVVDLGKGRAALKAGNGRFVSAAGEGVVLKDLAGKTPGDAESFQWINLMRGDTMLMSLTNHRYLATKTNNPGPVTVTATGPQADRKDGACFKWKAVG
jgi:xylan 1,4-beta-xylosidase